MNVSEKFITMSSQKAFFFANKIVECYFQWEDLKAKYEKMADEECTKTFQQIDYSDKKQLERYHQARKEIHKKWEYKAQLDLELEHTVRNSPFGSYIIKLDESHCGFVMAFYGEHGEKYCHLPMIYDFDLWNEHNRELMEQHIALVLQVTPMPWY